MAVSDLDYFRCDAFELNFRLHVLGGFWPLKTNVRWKQILFSIFSFLSYFSLTSIIIIQTVDIYIFRHDPVRLTDDLCIVASSYTIILKSHFILYKIDVVNRLKEKFIEYKNTRSDPVHVEILENTNREISVMRIIFGMLTMTCLFFWILFPGLDSDGPRKLPFPYLVPEEGEWPFPIWVVIYVYHSMAMVGFLINVLSVDAIFYGFVLRINAHYGIIMENLKCLDGLRGRDWGERWNEEETKLAERIVKENVELHKSILEDMKLFEEVYGVPFLIHVGGIITILGTAIAYFVRLAKHLNFQTLQRLLYVGAGLWDTFLYCYYGSKIQEKSLELSAAVYGVPWYRMKPEVRKDLRLILFKCQKVPTIRVIHFFSLDLKTFVSVLKISYDVTALLFQAVKE